MNKTPVTADVPVPPTTVLRQSTTAAKSWADQANELAQVNPNLSFKDVRKVRVCGKATGGNVKGVPRQLTCFVGRLDARLQRKTSLIF